MLLCAVTRVSLQRAKCQLMAAPIQENPEEHRFQVFQRVHQSMKVMHRKLYKQRTEINFFFAWRYGSAKHANSICGCPGFSFQRRGTSRNGNGSPWKRRWEPSKKCDMKKLIRLREEWHYSSKLVKTTSQPSCFFLHLHFCRATNEPFNGFWQQRSSIDNRWRSAPAR